MEKWNKVFIATSIDGLIADKEGKVDWLHDIPNPEGEDMGFVDMMNSIDAIVMGRVTYETVLGFGIDWPYSKPVYVLSTTLNSVPEVLQGKVFLIRGELESVLKEIHSNGHFKLYIDGGNTIHSFLKKDLIDEMIITQIPLVLGGGVPLFKELALPKKFKGVDSKVYLGQVIQNRFVKG